MASSDKELRFNNSRYTQKYDDAVFEDDDVADEVDSLQNPYPADDLDEDDIVDVDDGEESENLHEYEDNDHPHQHTPPSAGLDDYSGVSGGDRTNAFEQQNPLQSNYPSSNSDR